jgi:outer membrane lipoprotein-sorting protein
MTVAKFLNKKVVLYAFLPYIVCQLTEKRMKMKKFPAVALMMYAFAAQAQTTDDLHQIEDYLNNIRTIKADFVQMASNGTTSEGKIYISKPSKIRMEYAAPTSVLIVGNGDYVVFNDQELDQITNIDYDDIPATMILANNIKLDGKTLRVSDFYKDSGTTSVTVEYTKSKDVGPITLVFQNNPFMLKQWKIIDPQGIEVTLSLYDTAVDQDLSDELFRFNKQGKNRRKR